MRKFIVYALAICLIVILSGCGSDIEKRLTALESENARITSQLNDISKRLGIPETSSYASSETQDHTQPILDTNNTNNTFSYDLSNSDNFYAVYSYGSAPDSIKVQINSSLGWEVIEANEKLVVAYSKDWVDILIIYEIDPTITTAEDCEKRVRSITENYQAAGIDYTDGKMDYSEYGILYEQRFLGRELLNDLSNINASIGKTINYNDTWWMGIVPENYGAYYYHEKSIQNDTDSIAYSLLEYEAYCALSKTGVHITAKVNSFDYINAYNKADTTIRRTTMEREWELFQATNFAAWQVRTGPRSVAFSNIEFMKFLSQNSTVH